MVPKIFRPWQACFRKKTSYPTHRLTKQRTNRLHCTYSFEKNVIFMNTAPEQAVINLKYHFWLSILCGQDVSSPPPPHSKSQKPAAYAVIHDICAVTSRRLCLCRSCAGWWGRWREERNSWSVAPEVTRHVPPLRAAGGLPQLAAAAGGRLTQKKIGSVLRQQMLLLSWRS